MSQESPDAVPVERPDTDDYDLLTFGEVAARLDEEVRELERARAEAGGDQHRIEQLDERIALLKASGEEYRREQNTKDVFTRRFGAAIATPPQQRPRWQ